MKTIIFTVTNDLTYDQRMMRICGSLSSSGYDVLLVGIRLKRSLPLIKTLYRQERIKCWFSKGKLFYCEFTIRLFFYLLFKKADCICAIDLDTILPCYFASQLKGAKKVQDAHEYFSQLDEVISRPGVYKFWHWVERKMLPRFKNGYTVCQSIANEFLKHYGIKYRVVRNVPVLKKTSPGVKKGKTILYQGAVNKGRGLDKLVEAMKYVPAELVICGDGNFINQIKETIKKHNVGDKVKLTGMLLPEQLKQINAEAYIGVNPFGKRGLNQYLSLSNKFFDYIHAVLPQVTMNFPEYRAVNEQYEVAVLIDSPEPALIASALNKLLSDDVLYQKLEQNCLNAREVLNWQNEEKVLLGFYHQLFNE